MFQTLKDFAAGIHAANAIRHNTRPPAAARTTPPPRPDRQPPQPTRSTHTTAA